MIPPITTCYFDEDGWRCVRLISQQRHVDNKGRDLLDYIEITYKLEDKHGARSGSQI